MCDRFTSVSVWKAPESAPLRTVAGLAMLAFSSRTAFIILRSNLQTVSTVAAPLPTWLTWWGRSRTLCPTYLGCQVKDVATRAAGAARAQARSLTLRRDHNIYVLQGQGLLLQGPEHTAGRQGLEERGAGRKAVLMGLPRRLWGCAATLLRCASISLIFI